MTTTLDKLKRVETISTPEGWREGSLKDVLQMEIRHGLYKPRGFFGKGTKLLKMGIQYSSDRIGTQEMERVDLTTKEIERYTLHEDDLVFSRTSMMTDGAGKCSIVIRSDEPIVFDGNLLCATLNKKIADPLFYFYYFGSRYAKQKISEITMGTQSRNISASNLVQVPIPIPPRPHQKSIAKILSDLDYKIELNQQTNRTLEEIVKAIFTHWFIDFEFPNEEGEPYRSSGGQMVFNEELRIKVPRHWSVGQLDEIAAHPKRGIRLESTDQKMPYIGLEHMPRKSIALSDWGSSDKVISNKFQFSTGEFLFGKLRPYFHKVGIAAVSGVCSTDILVIVPRAPEWHSFVLGHISSDEFVNYADAVSTGTRMPRANWTDLARYSIVFPTAKNVLEKFNLVVCPLLNKLNANILQRKALISIRESLLPKLMSGKVKVPLQV